jgi:hypothetical protein
MKSLKIILEGNPGDVEAIIDRLKTILTITYDGKNQRLVRKPDEVRRTIRVRPQEDTNTGGNE